MIKVALFMTMNHDMTKYSGIFNLINKLRTKDNFKVYILYRSNVPDSVLEFIKTTDIECIKYSTYYTNSEDNFFDYIITIDPYYGPYCKGNGYLKWKSKIIFCEYGISGLDGSLNYLFKLPIYKKADLVITDTKHSAEKIVELSGRDKDIIVGNPIFDHKYKEGNSIVWSPHCSVYNGGASKILDGKKYSTFMDYKELFLEIPGYFDKYEFIYKLHPALKLRIQNMYDDTGEYFDLDSWIKSANDISNVRVPDNKESYLDIFDKSCMILNDSISFIAEYLVTMKPMIILRGYDRYSDFAEEIIRSCYYEAKNEKDIIRNIKMLLSGEDPKQHERLLYLNRFYKNINYPYSNSDYIIKYMEDNIK